MITDIRREVNRQRTNLIAAHITPTTLFVDEHTRLRLMRDARESLSMVYNYGDSSEWFEGLRLYSVSAVQSSHIIKVSP